MLFCVLSLVTNHEPCIKPESRFFQVTIYYAIMITYETQTESRYSSIRRSSPFVWYVSTYTLSMQQDIMMYFFERIIFVLELAWLSITLDMHMIRLSLCRYSININFCMDNLSIEVYINERFKALNKMTANFVLRHIKAT